MSDGFPITIGLASSFLLISSVLYLRSRLFFSKAQLTKATVTEVVWNEKSNGGKGGYSLVYQFRLLTGEIVSVQDSLTMDIPIFKVSQKIDVLYDPEKPQNARVKKWLTYYPSTGYFVSAMFFLIGIIFAFVSGWLYFNT